MRVSLIRVTARSPVAWTTSQEETNVVKLVDKAILGVVSESSGRNASELGGGLVNNRIRRSSLHSWGEGSTGWRIWLTRHLGSGGVVEAAR
jgi:hypothetical protein